MRERITVPGLIATTPRHVVTPDGESVLHFRMSSTQHREPDDTGPINWYGVIARHQLAENALRSLIKGQYVIVTGALAIRDWESGERSGVSVEIEADTIGHDLSYGTAVFNRVVPKGRIQRTTVAGGVS